jgi:Na+-translocating ferredoxin:NAD+ oxidoreductase RnfC subunit
VEVHPMKEYRRVPQSQLRKRLKIEEYDVETPFEELQLKPASVRIKLKQHAGKPAAPVVKEGAKVAKGQTIARVDEPDLGANIHASIGGKVRKITAEWIEIS